MTTPTQARKKQRAGEGMVRSADFRDKNGNGTDDRDEGTSGKDTSGEGMVRTADFRDRNGNGTDDRDEGGGHKQYWWYSSVWRKRYTSASE